MEHFGGVFKLDLPEKNKRSQYESRGGKSASSLILATLMIEPFICVADLSAVSALTLC